MSFENEKQLLKDIRSELQKSNNSGGGVTTPWAIAAALGQIPGVCQCVMNGESYPITTSTDPMDIGVQEPSLSVAQYYTGQAASYTPSTVDIFSASTNDDHTTGTGAWTVRIKGLETSASTDFTTEDVDLDGTTKVTSTKTWWRIVELKVIAWGTGGTNAGAIDCEETGDDTMRFGTILAGKNKSLSTAYTVPAGKTMLINSYKADTRSTTNSATAPADISVLVKDSEEVGYAPLGDWGLLGYRPTVVEYDGGICLPAGTDFLVRVNQVNSNNLIINFDMEFYLFDN